MDYQLRNKVRGYQQLRVWNDAIEFYTLNWETFKTNPFEMKRIASNALASADSVHRNIAEGYCRRSIREYIQFLYIAIASLGESVSGFHAYLKSDQLSKEKFDKLNMLAFKIENGLLKLIQSLEVKRNDNEWSDTLVQESNAVYNSLD